MQSLYPLLIANSDDFGRLPGDAFTVKHAVFPISPRTEAEFATALQAMSEVGLIDCYESAGQQVIQIVKFDSHQPGLHRRTESEFPPPGAKVPTPAPRPLNASERQVEDYLAEQLRTGRLAFGTHRIVTVEQQTRVRQFYLDIVAKTESGTTLLIEVKRQRVTSAAITQVREYRSLLDGVVEMSVIGHGLAAGLDTSLSDVLIGIYDDSLRCEPVNVRECSRTFTHVHEIPSEEKGREEKRKEGKKSVSSTPPAAAEPAVLSFPTVGTGEHAWALTSSHVAELQEGYPNLDVLAECQRALAWIRANPGRRKTNSGMPRFVNGWMARAVNSDRGTRVPTPFTKTSGNVDAIGRWIGRTRDTDGS